MQQRTGLRILIILAELGFPKNIYYLAQHADRNAERFAESAQPADLFAESTKVEDRNAKGFADRFANE